MTRGSSKPSCPCSVHFPISHPVPPSTAPTHPWPCSTAGCPQAHREGMFFESFGGQGLGKDRRRAISCEPFPSCRRGSRSCLSSCRRKGSHGPCASYKVSEGSLGSRGRCACSGHISRWDSSWSLSLARYPQSFPPHDPGLKSRSDLNPTQPTAICRALRVHPRSILAEGLHGGPCRPGREESIQSRGPRSRGRSSPLPQPQEPGAASTLPAAAPSSGPCSCSWSSSSISFRAPEQDRGWDMCRASSQPDGNHP